MRVRRLFSGVVAVLVVAALLAGGMSAAPAQAQECPPETGDVCEGGTELEDFTGIFLDLQVDVTGPSQPTDGAVAAFVTAVVNALSAREQAINSELNGMRVAQAAIALQGVVQRTNMLSHPDPSIRWQFVNDAADAAYLAENLLTVTSDQQTVGELGQVGMAAYALYLTGLVAGNTTIPEPQADGELIIVLGEVIRFLIRWLSKVPVADTAAEAKETLEEALDRVRNRDPDEGGNGSIEYIALGDSYASGSGTGQDSAPGPVDCHRSRVAYPGLLDGRLTAEGKRIHAVNVACHGAVIRDYSQPQLQRPGIEGPQRLHLSTQTTALVTVSMGGNDLGFERIVKDCLNPFKSNCGVAPGSPLVTPEKLAQVQTALKGMYEDILRRIRPDGQLVIFTYPNIAPAEWSPEGSCAITDLLIRNSELRLLANTVTQITDMIKEAAILAGGHPKIRVVDMSDAFRLHTICDTTDQWANALAPRPRTLYDSFHPNARGHRQYAQLITWELGLITPIFP